MLTSFSGRHSLPRGSRGRLLVVGFGSSQVSGTSQARVMPSTGGADFFPWTGLCIIGQKKVWESKNFKLEQNSLSCRSIHFVSSSRCPAAYWDNWDRRIPNWVISSTISSSTGPSRFPCAAHCTALHLHFAFSASTRSAPLAGPRSCNTCLIPSPIVRNTTISPRK